MELLAQFSKSHGVSQNALKATTQVHTLVVRLVLHCVRVCCVWCVHALLMLVVCTGCAVLLQRCHSLQSLSSARKGTTPSPLMHLSTRTHTYTYTHTNEVHQRTLSGDLFLFSFCCSWMCSHCRGSRSCMITLTHNIHALTRTHAYIPRSHALHTRMIIRRTTYCCLA